MSTRPSRLRGVPGADKILAEHFDKASAAFDRDTPIYVTPGGASNWVTVYAKVHPDHMLGGPARGLANQPEMPMGVDHKQDALHGAVDFKSMTAAERHAWVHANPGLAAAMLAAAKARKE
jgi:hypothetical protein